jgi:hypothetical protein
MKSMAWMQDGQMRKAAACISDTLRLHQEASIPAPVFVLLLAAYDIATSAASPRQSEGGD